MPYLTSGEKSLERNSLKARCYFQFVGYNDEILDMKFLGSSEREAVVATNSSQVRLYDLTTMDCQLLSAHSGKYQDFGHRNIESEFYTFALCFRRAPGRFLSETYNSCIVVDYFSL